MLPSPSNHTVLTTLLPPTNLSVSTSFTSEIEEISRSSPVVGDERIDDFPQGINTSEIKQVHPRPLPSETVVGDERIDDFSQGINISEIKQVHPRSLPSETSNIDVRQSLSAEAMLLKHRQFEVFLESNPKKQGDGTNITETKDVPKIPDKLTVAKQWTFVPYAIHYCLRGKA